MSFLRKYADKVLLVLCVAGFLASAGFALLGFRKLDAIAARNPTAGVELAKYEPQPAQMPSIASVTWPDAPPQSRGREWVYDVFTPPVIYYNRSTAEFTVTPPSFSEPVVAANDAPFEVDLVLVRQEPYRIQLVGYVGDQGAYLATFELMETGETAYGRPGRTFEQGAFTLQSLDVRRETTNSRESMPVIEEVAVATILDERTGREEVLTTRERKMLPRLQAILRLRASPAEYRTVREGTSVEVHGYSYLVTQLSLNPPQAVISRRSPDSLGASETRTLVPVPDAMNTPAESVPAGPTLPAARFPNLTSLDNAPVAEIRARRIFSFPSR